MVDECATYITLTRAGNAGDPIPTLASDDHNQFTLRTSSIQFITLKNLPINGCLCEVLHNY